MAVAFSFPTKTVVRVSGSAANSLPGTIVIKGVMAVNNTTKGAGFRIKDLAGGQTVFYFRAPASFTSNPDYRLPTPIRCDGILVSTMAEGEMLIYKG